MKALHAVRAAAMNRNHARAAMPRLRRTLPSIRPKMFLDPLGERHRFSRLGSDVLRLRADEAVVFYLLPHQARAPGDPPNRRAHGGRHLLESHWLHAPRSLQIH